MKVQQKPEGLKRIQAGVKPLRKIRTALQMISFSFIICHLSFSLCACTDELFDDLYTGGTATDDTESIRFGITTMEQADIVYDLARTRGQAPDSAFIRANTPQAFPFEGDAHGLQVHTMPLPLIEIHPGTASAPGPSVSGPSASGPSASGSSALGPSASGPSALGPSGSRSCENIATTEPATQPATTRAPLSEIASTENFHDSLTIWGFISASTTAHSDATLFNKVNLKKVRGWRSSVHWPYDGDEGGTRSMRFYAISPAIDELELSGMNTPSYGTAPKFNYHVVKEVDEHRDLLYGVSTNGGQTGSTVTTESAEIGINKGPIHGGNYTDNGWTEQRHLGQDDKLIDLKFEHILTAVRFVQGKIPTSVKITKISLQNIYSRGTFTGDASTAMGGSWSEHSTPENYNIDVAWQPKEWNESNYIKSGGGVSDTYKDDPSVSPYIDGKNVYIDRNQVMFLLPQELPASAVLQVELAEVYEEDVIEAGVTTHVKGETKVDALGKQMVHIISANISKTPEDNPVIWAKGHTVTYKITIGELRGDYELVVEAPEVFPHSSSPNSLTEQSKTYSVHSYRLFTDYSSVGTGEPQSYHAVGWQVTGFYSDISCDEDKKVDFADTFIKSIDGNGSTVNGVADTDTDGDGKLDDKRTVNITIKEQSEKYGDGTSGNHETLLGENAASSPADRWDLSKMKVVSEGYTYDSSYERITANSYIINRHGTYRLPMIYGNASEYASLATQAIFVDHEGGYIRQAWITDQLNSAVNTGKHIESVSGETTTITDQRYNYSDATAELIWQDRMLIKSTPSISQPEDGQPNHWYIDFTIASGDLKPGNAVIALKGRKTTTTVATTIQDGDQTGSVTTGTVGETTTTCSYDSETDKTTTVVTTVHTDDTPEVLWSWHIWVTDEIYPNHDESKSRLVELPLASVTTMPVNLGWVADNPEWKHYAYREIYAKIEQVDASNASLATKGGKTAVIKIAQKALQPLITGTATFYQWGRANALPMVAKAKEGGGLKPSVERIIYNVTNDVVTLGALDIRSNQADALKLAIKNPLRVLRNSDRPLSQDWFDPLTDLRDFWGSDGTKSLYDPCPPGFKLPNSNIFAPNYVDNYPNNAGELYGMYYYPTVYHNSVGYNDADYNTWDVPYFYIPATGNWSANGGGNNIWKQLDDEKNGYLWTSTYNSDSSSDNYGPGYLKIYMTNSNDKNELIYDYNITEGDGYFSRGMQIRPVGTGRYDR